MPLKDGEKNLVVYRGKELADVALEYPGCAGVIFRYLIRKCTESIRGPVCPLPYAAGAGVRDELFVEMRVEHPVERVVEQSVTHARLVDVAGFGVGNAEVMIAAMAVSLTH